MSKRIKDAIVSVCVSAVVVLAVTAIPLWASQNSLYNSTTGTLSGLAMVQGFNNALDSVNTCNSGASAPSNQLSGAPSAGNCWYNTATGAVQFYDGAQWLTIGTIDASNHSWDAQVGGGASSVASAATTDLCSGLPQFFLTVTGTTAIASFGASCKIGQEKVLQFAGALTLTYNATSLIIPGAQSITTAAGDIAKMLYLGSGNWLVENYTPATGQALYSPAVDVGDVVMTFLTAPPSTKYLFAFGQPVSRTTYTTLLSAITITQSVSRTSGSPTLSGFSDTTQIPAGAPVEGTGIPASTTISSCTTTACTMSQNASSTGTGSVTIFPNGNGDGSTTFNLPDCRGMTLAGRDNMGGNARGKLTSAFAGANPDTLGASLGAQSIQLSSANLPSFTSTNSGIAVSNPGASLTANQANSYNGGNTALAVSGVAAPNVPFTTQNIVIATNVSVSNQGSSTFVGSDTPISNVQPTLTANCMMRVLAQLVPRLPLRDSIADMDQPADDRRPSTLATKVG